MKSRTENFLFCVVVMFYLNILPKAPGSLLDNDFVTNTMEILDFVGDGSAD